MKRIILVQHTESYHHINNMVGSWTDWDLTEKGKLDARNIVENLCKEINLNAFKIITSDLKRCLTIAKYLEVITHNESIVLKDLRGKNYGEACGKSDDWLRNNQLPLIDGDPRNINYKYTISAENTIDLWKRVYPVFIKYFEKDLSDMIFVGHGDVLNVIYAMWLNLDVYKLDYVDIFTYPGSVSFLFELDNKKRIMTKLGDMSYMNKSGIIR